MEIEWNKLSLDERAQFAAWRQMEQAKADAKAQAAAEAAAKPPLYEKMTEAERRTWLRKQGMPIQPWVKP